MKETYLDYAATTYIDPLVLRKMKPYLTGLFGNPSSLHAAGRKVRFAIERARIDVARILNAEGKEIIFTGSGTESDNLAIFGTALAYKDKGRHIITTKIEHPAVMEAVKKLEKQGFEVTYLNVDSNGLVDIAGLKKSLRKDTILVSIIYANNEIGVIQPIAEIAEIIRNFRNVKCQTSNVKCQFVYRNFSFFWGKSSPVRNRKTGLQKHFCYLRRR